LLLKGETIERIRSGQITLLFRRWRAPRVRAGGRSRDARGVVEIVSVERAARLDARSADGAWTERVLRAIAAQPGVVSSALAAQLGMPRPDFKRRVRKLKELGLTESLEVGYRISPRGREVSTRLP
jgi:hypothetical protein